MLILYPRPWPVGCRITCFTPCIATLTTGNVVGIDCHVLNVSPAVTTSKAWCFVIGNGMMAAFVTSDVFHDDYSVGGLIPILIHALEAICNPSLAISQERVHE